MSGVSHHPNRTGLLLGALLSCAGCPGTLFGDEDTREEPRCYTSQYIAESRHVLLQAPGDTTTWSAAASFSGVGDPSADFSRDIHAFLSFVAADNAPETSEGYIDLTVGPAGAATPWVRERIPVVIGEPSTSHSVFADFLEPLAASCVGPSPCALDLEVGLTSFTSAVVSIRDIRVQIGSDAIEGIYDDCGMAIFNVDTGPEPLVPEEGDTDLDEVETGGTTGSP